MLDSVQVPSPEEALRQSVRGQYGEGTIDNKAVEAYRATKDVNPQSTTETYAALKLTIENWRWTGVPFYVRTGKRMAGRLTEIAVHFKSAPYQMFRNTPVDSQRAQTSRRLPNPHAIAAEGTQIGGPHNLALQAG